MSPIFLSLLSAHGHLSPRSDERIISFLLNARCSERKKGQKDGGQKNDPAMSLMFASPSHFYAIDLSASLFHLRSFVTAFGRTDYQFLGERAMQ